MIPKEKRLGAYPVGWPGSHNGPEIDILKLEASYPR